MKRIKLIYASFILALVFIYSCEQNPETLKNITSEKTLEMAASEDMFIFSNYNEYHTFLKKLNNFNEKELKAWEQKHNFTSLGKVCDEFYEKIKLEKFKNRQEVEDFLQKNKKYLQINRANGEISVEPLLDDYTERYFINKDRMYQIGDKVYKLFPEGKVSCHISNKESLANIDNPEITKKKDAFLYSPKKPSISYTYNDKEEKDWSHNCGYYKSDKERDGKNRIKLKLWFQRDGSTQPYPLVFSYLVKPQKKTFGIWFGCKRTLETHIRIRFDYYKDGTWKYDYVDIERKKGARHLRDNGAVTWQVNKEPFHMGAINAWATHPGISGRAKIRCNPSSADN